MMEHEDGLQLDGTDKCDMGIVLQKSVVAEFIFMNGVPSTCRWWNPGREKVSSLRISINIILVSFHRFRWLLKSCLLMICLLRANSHAWGGHSDDLKVSRNAIWVSGYHS